MTVSIYTYSLNERRLTQVGVVMCKLKAYIWAYTGILRARGKQGKTVLSFHIKIDMCQMIRSLFFWVVAHLMLVTDIFTVERATDTLCRTVANIRTYAVRWLGRTVKISRTP